MYAGLIPFLMPLLDSPRFFGAMLTVKGLERVSVADRGGGGVPSVFGRQRTTLLLV